MRGGTQRGEVMEGNEDSRRHEVKASDKAEE